MQIKTMAQRYVGLLLVGALLTGCGVFSSGSSSSATAAGGSAAGYSATGEVSFYANKFHGRKTASGAIFDQTKFTAAHRILPFGTRLKVTNLANGKSVMVVVNDRGPQKASRILDVSLAAARQLGMVSSGVAQARVQVCHRDAISGC